MSQVVSLTTTQNGFVNNISGAYLGSELGYIICTTTSSSDANANQAFWFFDTSDATTRIPAGSTIISAKFGVYAVASFWDEIGGPTLNFVSCNNACAGTTLDAGDYGVPPYAGPNSNFFASEVNKYPVGRYVVYDMGTTTCINRSGYTNVRCQAQANDQPAGGAYFDVAVAEGGQGHPAFIQLAYTLPDGTPMTQILVGR